MQILKDNEIANKKIGILETTLAKLRADHFETVTKKKA